MEEIKQDLKCWKANLLVAKTGGKVVDIEFARGTIFGLELALKRIEGKNNKKLQMDAEPCFVCGEVGSHDRNCPTFYGDM